MLYFILAAAIVVLLLVIFLPDEQPPQEKPNPLAQMIQSRLEALHAERQMNDIDRDVFRSIEKLDE